MEDNPLKKYRTTHVPPLSKAELARRLGVARLTVHRWETGTRRPDLELLPRIAEETGIAPKDLRPDLIENHEKIFGSDGE